MTLQPILIAGAWRDSRAPEGSFNAVSPAEKAPLSDQFPISGMAEIESAIDASLGAVRELRLKSPEQIASFLEAYADAIEKRADLLVDTAHVETALPKEPRLRTVELPRTTNQLRLAAAATRERSWCLPTIDTALNIRSKYGSLDGPVVIFGPNNFPFAFNGISGSDFAAAVAAGNPVIVKSNPAHPATTRLLAEAAFEAAQSTGMPAALVQMIYHTTPEVGLRMVSHPRIGAIGFTGSKAAGLRLKEAADRAGKPIYLELSSINPVFLLPGVLEERADAVAAELFASCAMGAGQFCTNPGFMVLPEGAAAEAFASRLKAQFESALPGVLLGERGPQHIASAVQVMQSNGAEVLTGGKVLDGPGYRYENTLLRVSGDAFLERSNALQSEAFGTVSLLVIARDTAQMTEIASRLEGNLTGTIYSHSGGADDDAYNRIEPELRGRVGRLLNDKAPTGVAVTAAMNHGGPYPATGHPGFTAVGIPASFLRFAALHCYDNVREHRLPEELRAKNPTGRTWRFIDGEWTRRDIAQKGATRL